MTCRLVAVHQAFGYRAVNGRYSGLVGFFSCTFIAGLNRRENFFD